MNYLKLSEETATTALNNLPDAVKVPDPGLSPSQTLGALAAVTSKEQGLIDATLSNLTSHLESIADFAQRVLGLDSDLSGVMNNGLQGVFRRD